MPFEKGVTMSYGFIVKLTTECNLRCSYCYHFRNVGSKLTDDSMSIIEEATLDKVIQRLIDFNDKHVYFIWHGGEPLLLGIEFFQKIIKLQEKHNLDNKQIFNSVQTNGILVNEEWAKFFKENNFRVGVSLDGHKELHINNRRLRKGHSSHEETLRGIEILKEFDVAFGILAVVTKQSISQAQEIFNFFVSKGIMNIGFLPAVVTNTEGHIVEQISVLPSEFSSFLTQFFEIWQKSGVHGFIVREFDEAMRGALGIPQKLCTFSNDCKDYFTILPNGDIYLCDCFPAIDKFHVGSIFEPLENIESSLNYSEFCQKISITPAKCKSCDLFSVCNGGCKYHRYLTQKDFTAESYYCDSIKYLRESVNNQISQLHT